MTSAAVVVAATFCWAKLPTEVEENMVRFSIVASELIL